MRRRLRPAGLVNYIFGQQSLAIMLTIIERILELDESALADIRVRIFDFLASRATESFTMRQLIEKVEGLPDNRRLLQPMMNVLFQYDLVEFDYNTKCYKYKESEHSRKLKNYINFLKAL